MILDAHGEPMEQRDVVTVASLVRDCRQAIARMSAKNPHRRVLTQCIAALLDLSVQVQRAKTESNGVPLIGAK